MAAPTHKLVIQRKAPEGTDPRLNKAPGIEIGAAFANGGSSLLIQLDDAVVIDWRMMETHRLILFTAFPKDRPE